MLISYICFFRKWNGLSAISMLVACWDGADSALYSLLVKSVLNLLWLWKFYSKMTLKRMDLQFNSSVKSNSSIIFGKLSHIYFYIHIFLILDTRISSAYLVIFMIKQEYTSSSNTAKVVVYSTSSRNIAFYRNIELLKSSDNFVMRWFIATQKKLFTVIWNQKMSWSMMHLLQSLLISVGQFMLPVRRKLHSFSTFAYVHLQSFNSLWNFGLSKSGNAWKWKSTYFKSRQLGLGCSDAWMLDGQYSILC